MADRPHRPEVSDGPSVGREHPVPAAAGQSRWHVAGCFVLMLIGLHLVAEPKVGLWKWHVIRNQNPAFQEGLAWRHGSLTLPQRTIDTALYKGRVYSVHPPLFALLTMTATALGGWQGVPEGTFYTPWYVMMVALPLPFIGFWAFQQVLRRAEWSAVLTAYWLLGTPMFPALVDCQCGSINALNHVLNGMGLMLIAGDLLGRKRFWPAAIGVVISVWSRPHMVFFGLAVIGVAWLAKTDRRRRQKIALAVAGLGLSAGTLMALDWVKFGSPLETGYRYIYDYRQDTALAKGVSTYGVFSPHFLPHNLWCMNLAPPRFRTSPALIQPDNTKDGVAIWMTSPLLLAAFLDLRQWWRNRTARLLVLASAVVIGTFLMYHATGAQNKGYFIYALDFLPVWLVIIAPWTLRGRHRQVTLACLAWSVLYFQMIA
ncbi:MAG: hypothetical protein ACE5F9_10525 [Phycisphaerae bacterium]